MYCRVWPPKTTSHLIYTYQIGTFGPVLHPCKQRRDGRTLGHNRNTSALLVRHGNSPGRANRRRRLQTPNQVCAGAGPRLTCHDSSRPRWTLKCPQWLWLTDACPPACSTTLCSVLPAVLFAWPLPPRRGVPRQEPLLASLW